MLAGDAGVSPVTVSLLSRVPLTACAPQLGPCEIPWGDRRARASLYPEHRLTRESRSIPECDRRAWRSDDTLALRAARLHA